MAAKWLEKAVFYEVYPQSFYDSNGDGIGDIQGIIEKLDYIKALGCNALWLNPCFDSPFKDAGYDVRDYKKVASRYGTNQDLEDLFAQAHAQGIRVLLDLVPGHTSEEHAWFVASSQEGENPYSDRYIWTNNAFSRGDGLAFIGGEAPRNGTYIINFFKSQPALNYGFNQINEPSWQMPTTSPAALASREALKDIMRFWLDKGCDGFRVDMADSLVKNDGQDKVETIKVWQDITATIHKEYPEAVLVSEWNRPDQALTAGFDMDFYLDWRGNGYANLLRDYDIPKFGQAFGPNNAYFAKNSDRDIFGFLDDYLPQYEKSKDKGLWCLISGNHDTIRLAPLLDDGERRLAFAFLLTMPGAPFIYYGDEIGLAYRWLATKEGGYQRTGSRSPMQWDRGKNLGFSASRAQDLYLPVDERASSPVVADQMADDQSFFHHVKGLIALRQKYGDLGNYSNFSVVYAQKGSRLFAYQRGGLLVAVNPGQPGLDWEVAGDYKIIYQLGQIERLDGKMRMGGQSFGVFQPI